MRYALVCGFLLMLIHPLSAQQLIEKYSNTVNGGTVLAIAEDEKNGVIYLGGGFTRVGKFAANGALLDAVNGKILETSARVNGQVRTSCPDGMGGYYIGGFFSEVGGLARENIAHINVQGEVTSWGENIRLNQPVAQIQRIGNTIYAGGGFTRVGSLNNSAGAFLPTGGDEPDHSFPKVEGGGINVVIPDGAGGFYIGGTFNKVGDKEIRYLAQITADGSVSDWNPDVGGFVWSLALSGDQLYIGGQFTSIGDEERNRMGSVDITSGTVSSWNPNANNLVRKIEISDGVLYAGGNFTEVGGVVRNRVAAIDLVTGLPTAFNPNVNDRVFDIGVANGALYVTGRFTEVGGTGRNRLAAINLTSGVVTSWNPNLNNSATSLALSDSHAFVAGFFTQVGTQACNRLAKINLTTGTVDNWNPDIEGSIETLTLSGQSLYIGGNFSSVGGTGRNRIAELDINTGVASAWNPDASTSINSIAVSESGIYLGISSAFFSSFGGEERNRLAAFDATSGELKTWNPGANNPVFAMTQHEGVLYVGGSFTEIGGEARNRIAALTPSTGVVTDWNPDASGQIFTLDAEGNNIYAGGQFLSIGGESRSRIAALDKNTGLATIWNPNANDDVYAIKASGSSVYAGGRFGIIGGENRSRFAELDVNTGAASAWNPGFGTTGSGVISAITISGDLIYVGGGFAYTEGSQFRSGLVALNKISQTATSWNPGPDNSVSTISVGSSGVYVGGSFNAIGGEERKNLIALDSETGDPLAWNPMPDAPIQSLVLDNNKLYVGGNFSKIANENRGNLAVFDAGTLELTPWNPGVDGSVASIIVTDNLIYIGGAFGVVGGETRNNIAALDKESGLPSSWNPDASAPLRDLAISENIMYAGGGFTSIGGESRNYLAALDLTTGNATAWNPDLNNSVQTIDLLGDNVYVGGYFTSVGGVVRNRLAAIDISTGLPSSWDPDASDWVNDLSISEGRVFVAGGFNTVGTKTRRWLAALDITTGKATTWNPNPNSIVYSLTLSEGRVYVGGIFNQIAGQLSNRFAVISRGSEVQALTFGELTEQTYGASDFDLTGTSNSGLDVTYVSSDQSVATVSGSTVTLVGAGNAIITARQRGNDTYLPAEDVSQGLTVSKAALTVRAENKMIREEDPIPAFTLDYTGFVAGDSESDITPPMAGTTATPSSSAGRYPITLSGGSADDYELNLENGELRILPASATVDVQILLEGSFASGTMTPATSGAIGSHQPYTALGHAGSESFADLPAGAVDWVLVELREAGTAATAYKSTKVGSAAGLLMSDGSIKASDGENRLEVTLTDNMDDSFYLVVYHRNHLSVMSAEAVEESGGLYSIDFTTNATFTYQGTDALVALAGGLLGMPAGDADIDGDVDDDDLLVWRNSNGQPASYQINSPDFNLDGVINAIDRNGLWRKNSQAGKVSHVPKNND